MQNRNIALGIILSIITCGIYAIYWQYTVFKAFEDAQCPSRPETSPGITVLLSIVTCGIYGAYAFYKVGRATPELFQIYGKDYAPNGDPAILYLVMAFFGYGMINLCLVQNDINTIVGPVYANQPYTAGQQAYTADPQTYQQQPGAGYPYPPQSTYPSPFDANAQPPQAPPPPPAPYGNDPTNQQ